MANRDRDRDRPWNSRRGRLNYGRRVILEFLASQPRCWDAHAIHECRGLRRLSLELVWESLRTLVDQGLVLVSYEVEYWEAAGFRHAASYPVFWHWVHSAKWLPSKPGTHRSARPPRGEGADG